MIKTYYRLTKPGIIYGNDLMAAAGFLLASKSHIDIARLLVMLGGLSLVIASACVFNNYIDRDIDRKMQRTKKRALASGEIPVMKALAYGAILLIAGAVILGVFINLLALAVSLGGFIAYVGLYSYFKRQSSLGTVVGSISGATPPVIGYCAVTGRLDLASLILFLTLVFWQMPHFYSISIYRYKDYKAAGVPVLTVKKGFKSARLQILLYIIAFITAAAQLTVFDYTGFIYLAVIGLVGALWLRLAAQGFKTSTPEIWARGMFRFSLIVTLVLALMWSIGGRLA